MSSLHRIVLILLLLTVPCHAQQRVVPPPGTGHITQRKAEFVVFDPSGIVQKALQKSRRGFVEVATLEAWNGRGVLVIGPQAASKTIAKVDDNAPQLIRRYALSLTARGTSSGRVWPQIGVSMDGLRVGLIALSSSTARSYAIVLEGSKGRHTLRFEYLNDDGHAPEDRNLWLDKWTLGRQIGSARLQNLTTPATLSRLALGRGQIVLSSIRWDDAGSNTARAHRFMGGLLTAMDARFRAPGAVSSVEVERFTLQPNRVGFRRQSNGVYMSAGGWIKGQIEVAQAGRYVVRVWGKGTSSAGHYPIIELNVVQPNILRMHTDVGQIEIKSDDWAPHTLIVRLPQGQSTLSLNFLNPTAAFANRNLWLDRLEFERIGP